MWPFSALMGRNMFAAKELKVGKRYKVPSHRGVQHFNTQTTLGKWNKIRSNI